MFGSGNAFLGDGRRFCAADLLCPARPPVFLRRLFRWCLFLHGHSVSGSPVTLLPPSGHRLYSVSDAADVTGWFGYPAVVAGDDDGTDGYRLYSGKSAVTQILRRYGYRSTLFAITLADRRNHFLLFQSPNARFICWISAAVYTRDGDVHSVHRDEYPPADLTEHEMPVPVTVCFRDSNFPSVSGLR